MKPEIINLDDEIFKFVNIIAMNDAVMRLAFIGNKKRLKEDKVLERLKAKMEVFFEKVLNDGYTSQDEYDKDFLNKTWDICNVCNKEQSGKFTFGNAQKLINMMLKYFYISSYKDGRSKEKFRFCHCPMDQRLLEDVWSKRANLDDNIKLGKRDFFLKSWGKEDFEKEKGNKIKNYPARYDKFQRAVRFLAKEMEINPLEYDYYIYNRGHQA